MHPAQPGRQVNHTSVYRAPAVHPNENTFWRVGPLAPSGPQARVATERDHSCFRGGGHKQGVWPGAVPAALGPELSKLRLGRASSSAPASGGNPTQETMGTGGPGLHSLSPGAGKCQGEGGGSGDGRWETGAVPRAGTEWKVSGAWVQWIWAGRRQQEELGIAQCEAIPGGCGQAWRLPRGHSRGPPGPQRPSKAGTAQPPAHGGMKQTRSWVGYSGDAPPASQKSRSQQRSCPHFLPFP